MRRQLSAAAAISGQAALLKYAPTLEEADLVFTTGLVVCELIVVPKAVGAAGYPGLARRGKGFGSTRDRRVTAYGQP
jgi:hypothetical protein